jgi:hypothetical protein
MQKRGTEFSALRFFVDNGGGSQQMTHELLAQIILSRANAARRTIFA